MMTVESMRMSGSPNPIDLRPLIKLRFDRALTQRPPESEFAAIRSGLRFYGFCAAA